MMSINFSEFPISGENFIESKKQLICEKDDEKWLENLHACVYQMNGLIMTGNNVLDFKECIEVINKRLPFIEKWWVKNTNIRYIIYQIDTLNDIFHQPRFGAEFMRGNILHYIYNIFMAINDGDTDNIYRTCDAHRGINELTLSRYALSQASNLSFTVPYCVDNKRVKIVRGLMNKFIRQIYKNKKIKNIPDPGGKKIGIVASKIFPESALYRSVGSQIKFLIENGYDVEIIVEELLGDEPFENIKKIDIIEYDIVTDWNYCYFVDVGMCLSTSILSNFRLAPIQITGYGHPVTTSSDKIDYFIGASWDDPEKYTEKLFKADNGLSVDFTMPTNLPEKESYDNGLLNVGILWSSSKVNYNLLKTMIDYVSKYKIKYKIHLISAIGASKIYYSNVIARCGEMGNIEHRTIFNQTDYLSEVGKMDFCVDSYPFGSYNSLLDCLAMKTPFLAIEGGEAYNRLAASVLRTIGLSECITTMDEFEKGFDFMVKERGKIIIPPTEFIEGQFSTSKNMIAQLIKYTEWKK